MRMAGKSFQLDCNATFSGIKSHAIVSAGFCRKLMVFFTITKKAVGFLPKRDTE